MSDVSVRMTLTENVSAKLKNVANAGKAAATQLSSTGKEIDKAFSSNAPNSFARSAESAISSVSGEAESLGSAIDSALDGMDNFNAGNFGSMRSSLSGAADSVDDFAEAAGEAGESMEDMADSAEELGENIDDIGSDSGLDDVGDDADRAGQEFDEAAKSASNLGNILKTVFAAISVAKIAGEVKDFLSDSMEVGKNFTSMMSEVGAISGATGDDLARLEATAREYGATTIFSATEAAEALKYMSLAGWDAQQSTSALGGVLNLAAASGMGLGEASDMVTDYLSAFGMQANQAAYFADMLSYAQSHSNTTASRLGEAYLNSAANLHAAGQDVETTTSLLEAMANQGTKGARAGTQLAAIARDITNSMENGAIKIGDTSIAVQDAQGNFRDFTDVLTEVGEAVDGMGSAERAAALSEVFTADSTKGINQILTEGMSNIAQYEEELRNSTGAAEQAADTMNDNLTGDIANMNSAFEEMQLQVFEGMEGTAREGVQYLTSTVIPTLTEWVPDAVETVTDSIGKVGKVLSPLLETVLQNPQGVATAFGAIGTGIAAFKTINRVSALSKLVSSGGALSESGGLVGGLAKLGTTLTAHPWAAGAAAVTAAVVAIGAAIHKYNETQIENSLSDHFGDVTLTAEQIQSAAGHILNAKYLVNIQGALNQFENADALAKEAEAALEANNALEWKASIGMTWDENEVSEYVANIDTFISNSIEELESRTYAATITVQTMLGNTEEGQTLVSQMETWAAQDELEMQALSEQLSSAVEKAMMDGVLSADEQAAITILQSKMNNILSSWKEADSQAAMDLINQKYGSMSGKDLTVDTFTSIVEELGEQRAEALEAVDTASQELYGTLNGLLNSGRITEQQGEMYKNMVAEAARNMEASALVNSVDFETNTMNDAYSEKLKENYDSMVSSTKSWLDSANTYFANEDYTGLWNTLQSAYNGSMVSSGWFSGEDQRALADRWEILKPDATAMQSLIEEYRSIGQAIPESLMNSYNEAMMLGAASGDYDASWAVFANQMVESAGGAVEAMNDPLISAIQEGLVSVPPELKKALDIALAETTADPIEMDNLMVAISGMDLDVSQIAELTGMTEAEVQAYLDQYGIEVDEKVDVKTQAGEVDGSGAAQAGQAAEEAAKIEAGGDTTVDKTVTTDTTYVAGTTDTSQVENAATEQLSSGTAEQEIVTDTTYVPGTTDVSQVTSGTQAALENQTVESTATANVTAQVGQTNFEEVASSLASKFDSAVKAAFNKTFQASTSVSITVNYSIANPSKTITFSGGGTGTATVYAHAAGGIFDTPHYGVLAEAGPEAYIPLDGSDNAKAIWQEAGEILGMMDSPITTAPETPVKGDTGSGGVEKSSSKEISININGTGNLRAGGGLSKDDVVAVLMEHVRDAIISIVEEDILVEGDGAYEY